MRLCGAGHVAQPCLLHTPPIVIPGQVRFHRHVRLQNLINSLKAAMSTWLQSLQGNQSQGGLGLPRPASPGPSSGKGAGLSSREGGAAEGEGEEDVQGAKGFHVGLAPTNLRPPQGIDTGRGFLCLSVTTSYQHAQT